MAINHGGFGGKPHDLVNAGAVAAYKAEAALIAAGGYTSDAEYLDLEAALLYDGSVWRTDRGGDIYTQSVVAGLQDGDIVEVDNNYWYDDGSGYSSYWDQAKYWVLISPYTHNATATINNWMIYFEPDGLGGYTMVVGSGQYNTGGWEEDFTTVIGDKFQLTRDVTVWSGATLVSPLTSSRGYTYSTTGITDGTQAATSSLTTPDFTYVPASQAWVDDGWASNYNGDVVSGHIYGQDAFDSIQQAINGTAAGGTVDVAAGLYDEYVTIGKALTLRGATYGVSKKSFVTPAPPAYAYDTDTESVLSPTADIDQSVLRVQADAVTVDGMAVARMSVAAAGSNKSLVELGFTSAYEFFTGVQVLNCVVGPCTGPAQDGTLGRFGIVAPGPSCYSLTKTRKMIIRDNTVYDCLGNGGAIAFIGAYDTGIEINAGSAVENNTITGNHRSGIEFAGSLTGTSDDPFVIANNTITNNGKKSSADAAALKYGNGIAFIRGGSDRTNGAPYASTDYIQIYRNVIEDNEKNGIYIGPINKNMTIEQNFIRNNGAAGSPYSTWDGIQTDLAELYYSGGTPELTYLQGIVAYDNCITGNGAKGASVSGGAPANGPVDASANWWGTATAAGVAALVTADVDYTPWLNGGTDVSGDPGFQGSFSVLNVDDDSPQAGATGRIQEGVDLVSGSTVNLMDGTYGADATTGKGVVISKNGLLLRGQSQAGTIIDGTIGGVGSSGSYWPRAVEVRANDVTVQNLTITDFTGDEVNTGGYGIVLRDWAHDQPAEGYIFYDGCVVDSLTVKDCYSSVYALCFTHLTVSDCSVTDSDADGMFIARGCDYASIHDNTVTNSANQGIWVGYCWSGLEPSDHVSIYDNRVDGAMEGGISFVASTDAVIERNVITNVAGDGWSVGALSLKDGPSNVTARYNLIYGNSGTWGGYSGTGHGVGIDGAASNITLTYNSIYGNSGYGVYNYVTTTDVNARKCWWGSSSGPGGVGPGTGDEVTAHVLFDPWIGKAGGENIVCVDDPEYLTNAAPTKTVAVDYLGGGGGLVYGYSVSFSWDSSKVTLGTVTQGDLLSSQGTTYFFVSGTGNTRTVDCVLTGSLPGVTGPGTMFTVSFTAVGGAVGTSPIDLTVIKVRDKANAALSGFYEDDGLLVIDTANPSVSNVFIDNTTLTHTDDWVKNGDAVCVTATVTDDDPAFEIDNIKADLSGLGGSATAAPDSYVGDVATWCLASVTCTPANGTVTVYVTATDPIGNTTSGSDDITADNLAPGVVSSLAAAQQKTGNDDDGTTKITLTFTMPGDAYRVEVYRCGFGHYPEYDDDGGAEPAAPADYQNLGSWTLAGVMTSGDKDEPAARDYWYYVAFAKDMAWNVSAVSTKTTGTLNYHLGDVSEGGVGDNTVSTNDFSALSASYWVGEGGGSYLNYCDVGPTSDYSTDGLPATDNFVDFEDLMMFAMNFTTVSLLASTPVAFETPELSLVVDDQVGGVLKAHLMLTGNRQSVKGLHSAVSCGSGLELVAVSRGSLLTSQSGQVFFEDQASGGTAQVDAAVIGAGLTLRGSGEVAVLEFRVVTDGARKPLLAAASLRDRTNKALRLTVDPGQASETASLSAEGLGFGAYPNPFRGETQIALNVPVACEVALRVYDVSGRQVATLVDGTMEAGSHWVSWDGRSAGGTRVAPGVYLAVVRMSGKEMTGKLFVLP